MSNRNESKRRLMIVNVIVALTSIAMLLAVFLLPDHHMCWAMA
ncbi:MAG: hypothetical protein ACR2H5_23755 [Ktedonobacteraceae bacterium]